MGISHYLKEIGRGARGAKALDRAQAADDFDAQRRYARQDAELATLQADALLAQQREEALDQQRRLWIFLVALGVFAFLAVLGGWWLQQHANARLRIAVRAARASRFSPFIAPSSTVSAPEFRSGRKSAFQRRVARFG